MKFEGTDAYVAGDDLTVAVNAAVTLERPLLVKGEPGTGKTELARQVARAMGMRLIEWHVKSTTRAAQGLYEYDAVSRLRDSQLGDERVNDVRNYIRRGKLWEAFAAEERVVLLIDEIDKADIEFPNELPDAFLRRCFFHYIRFPDAETMRRIVEVHHPGLKGALLSAALTQFYEIRDVPGLKKKPSTSEVLDWLKLILAEDLTADDLRRDGADALPRLHGALLKNEQDVHLFERLAFMARRGR